MKIKNDGFGTWLDFTDQELKKIHKQLSRAHKNAVDGVSDFGILFDLIRENPSLWQAYCSRYDYDRDATYDDWLEHTDPADPEEVAEEEAIADAKKKKDV